jgi:hypothetical protein
MQTRNADVKLNNVLGNSSFLNGTTHFSKAPESGLLIQTQMGKQVLKPTSFGLQSPVT